MYVVMQLGTDSIEQLEAKEEELKVGLLTTIDLQCHKASCTDCTAAYLKHAMPSLYFRHKS